MMFYMQPVFEGGLESWGGAEVHLEIGFCRVCRQPLATGVCSFCGWTTCPLCGAHEDCEHLLPAIDCRMANMPGDEDEEGVDYENGAFELTRVLVNPAIGHSNLGVREAVEQAERDQPREFGLVFYSLHDLVRKHGQWEFGVPGCLRDERVLYELVHDPRLASRLEEEVWTRVAKDAGSAIVAVERIPVRGRFSESPRYRRWYASDPEAVLDAGQELEAKWSQRIEEMGESVRAHVGDLVCPYCDEPTFATIADELYSCSYCGAYECPIDDCGMQSVECGRGCSHSLGNVVDGALFGRKIDLSDAPVTRCDWDQLQKVDEATVRKIFGDLYPVLVEAYWDGANEPPNEACLLLELGRCACPDVRVEDYNGFSIPLARDVELGRQQYQLALVHLSNCFRALDHAAPAWKNVYKEDDHGQDA